MSKFQSFECSKFRNSEVSKFQSSNFPKFQSFKNHLMSFGDLDPILPNSDPMFCDRYRSHIQDFQKQTGGPSRFFDPPRLFQHFPNCRISIILRFPKIIFSQISCSFLEIVGVTFISRKIKYRWFCVSWTRAPSPKNINMMTLWFSQK